MRISRWQEPPQHLALAGRELHLWRMALQVSAATQRRLAGILSPDEAARAARLLDRKKAAEFVVARGRLRQILAGYLKLRPAAVAFQYNQAGKPQLHADLASGLSFNLAHSGDWALLAVAAGSEVGVDLERIDPRLDCRAIARRFFDPDETSVFEGFSEARRPRGFYRLWTRKEARLKRAGVGFSAGPKAATHLTPGLSRWFPIGSDHLGAICITEEIDAIRRYRFTET